MSRAVELLRDARLSEPARILGLFIESLGAGEHEIPAPDFQRLLHAGRSQDKVARAISDLELYGYVSRTPGGRGHANRYTFHGEPPADRSASSADLNPSPPDRSAPHADLNPPETDRSAPIAELSDRSAPDAEVNEAGADRSALDADLNDPAGETLRKGATPPNPPPPPSPPAREVGPREARLLAWLGEQHAEQLDDLRLAASYDHQRWELVCSKLWGSFVSGVSAEIFWREAPKTLGEADRPGILSAAMQSYALEAGKPFDVRFFLTFAVTARDIDARAKPRPPRVVAGSEAARVAERGVEIPGAARTASGTPTNPALLKASIDAFERKQMGGHPP